MSRNIKIFLSVGMFILGIVIISIAANVAENPNSSNLPWYIEAVGIVACGVAITRLLTLVIYNEVE
jgi:hypothetical protein